MTLVIWWGGGSKRELQQQTAMVKGADVVARKKNRVMRKRIRDKETVSARVAAIIASKRRRKAGKRRICEGMCFSLPTPEDPFNDRNNPKVRKSKKDAVRDKDNKQLKQSKELVTGEKANAEFSTKLSPSVVDRQTQKFSKCSSSNTCPSKYLCLCLNSIQNTWTQDSVSGDWTNEPLLASRWGFDFWRSYSSGSDILDMSGECASKEQIAWVISTAADTITRKEKDGLIVSCPFLLFLVDSQEKATEVRSVLKPLKDLGVHTVSVHPGASLDHQVLGLKSCEPEFLVSTPERLLDLVLLKAIDISGVSLLVLDGLKSFLSSGFEYKIKSVRDLIKETPQTVIFGSSNRKASTKLVHSLVREPTVLLPLKETTDS